MDLISVYLANKDANLIKKTTDKNATKTLTNNYNVIFLGHYKTWLLFIVDFFIILSKSLKAK